MERASRAPAPEAAPTPPRAAARRAAAAILASNAAAEGGFARRGAELQPIGAAEWAREDPAVALAMEGLVRLSRLAERAAERLADHPSPSVRRAAALCAARAYPILAAQDA